MIRVFAVSLAWLQEAAANTLWVTEFHEAAVADRRSKNEHEDSSFSGIVEVMPADADYYVPALQEVFPRVGINTGTLIGLGSDPTIECFRRLASILGDNLHEFMLQRSRGL